MYLVIFSGVPLGVFVGYFDSWSLRSSTIFIFVPVGVYFVVIVSVSLGVCLVCVGCLIGGCVWLLCVLLSVFCLIVLWSLLVCLGFFCVLPLLNVPLLSQFLVSWPPLSLDSTPRSPCGHFYVL